MTGGSGNDTMTGLGTAGTGDPPPDPNAALTRWLTEGPQIEARLTTLEGDAVDHETRLAALERARAEPAARTDTTVADLEKRFQGFLERIGWQ